MLHKSSKLRISGVTGGGGNMKTCTCRWNVLSVYKILLKNLAQINKMSNIRGTVIWGLCLNFDLYGQLLAKMFPTKHKLPIYNSVKKYDLNDQNTLKLYSTVFCGPISKRGPI